MCIDTVHITLETLDATDCFFRIPQGTVRGSTIFFQQGPGLTTIDRTFPIRKVFGFSIKYFLPDVYTFREKNIAKIAAKA